MCVRIARHAGGRIVWFSMHGDTLPDAVRAHVDQGGMAVVREAGVKGGTIVLYRANARDVLMQAGDIPATLGGIAEFNIANAMAAAAMAIAHGIPLETVRRALSGFGNSFEESPGRLNINDDHGFRVIVDYAHNPASLTALGAMIDRMRDDHGRVIGMVSIPGDRRDEDIVAMGSLAGKIFDEIVFREAPDGRGRGEGAVISLMSKGAIASGVTADRIRRIVDEQAAVDACLRRARPGDLVVLMPTSVEAVWRQACAFVPMGATASAHAEARADAQAAAHG